METNIHYSIVGAFVITLIATMVFAVIWLSSGFSFEHYSNYFVFMQESVSGLNIDSPVEFNGVNVGTVKVVQINQNNPQLVELILSIKSNTPVTQGTVATLNTRGVTGITYVALKDRSTDLRPLVARQGEAYPVIKTAPSLFVRIDTALNQVSTNLKEVTQSIQSVLDKQNQQSIKNILVNMDRVTDTLAHNSRKMSLILENTAKASQQLSPLVLSSTTAVRTLETQTLPQTYELLANLNSITQSMAQVSMQVRQNPSILIRGMPHATLGPGETR